MDPTDIGLFRLAESRMAWIDQRQAALAGNIANANTPGYKARDLSPFDATLMEQGLTLATTTPGQIGGRGTGAAGRETRAAGRAPNGNTVVMEDQLGKVASTSNDQELVLNIYHKYADLFRKVLGTTG